MSNDKKPRLDYKAVASYYAFPSHVGSSHAPTYPAWHVNDNRTDPLGDFSADEPLAHRRHKPSGPLDPASREIPHPVPGLSKEYAYGTA